MANNYQNNPWNELNPRGDEKITEFLQNLQSVLRNPEFLDVLSWNEGGDAFIIRDVPKMKHDVLPLYYNHNDLDSFIKDLAALGFQHFNIQNNQILCFHPKFKTDPNTLIKAASNKE